jgi:hypothetical protein
VRATAAAALVLSLAALAASAAFATPPRIAVVVVEPPHRNPSGYSIRIGERAARTSGEVLNAMSAFCSDGKPLDWLVLLIRDDVTLKQYGDAADVVMKACPAEHGVAYFTFDRGRTGLWRWRLNPPGWAPGLGFSVDPAHFAPLLHE